MAKTDAEVVPRFEIQRVDVFPREPHDDAEPVEGSWWGVWDRLEGAYNREAGFSSEDVAENECTLLNSMHRADVAVTS